MKSTNTIVTIIGFLAVLALGYYFLESKPNFDFTEINEETSPSEETGELIFDEEGNIIDTETGLFVEEAPLSTGVYSPIGTPPSIAVVETGHGANVSTASDTFVLGFYYVDTMNKKGIEACTGRVGGDTTEDIEFPDYSKEGSYQLTSVELKNRTAYIYVDAEESPENLCAYIMKSKAKVGSAFDAVHVVVR